MYNNYCTCENLKFNKSYCLKKKLQKMLSNGHTYVSDNSKPAHPPNPLPGMCGAFDNLEDPGMGHLPATVSTCWFLWQENEPPQ